VRESGFLRKSIGAIIEVSEVLGFSIPAVKSRLHRARLFLRDRLSDYFYEWRK
jgi:hypothetical protein